MSTMYPNLWLLYKMYACIPVTSCSAERSFSTLRRLKTHLRTRMGEDRLLGLTRMSIEAEATGKLDLDETVRQFIKKKGNRRVKFV